MSGWVCRIVGHNWEHSLTVGEAREFMCTRCRERKVIVNGVTLTPEDSKEKSLEMWYSAHAVMWILDNIEPTCTTERSAP